MGTTRRSFAKKTIAATAAFSLSSFLNASGHSPASTMKIVCVGGHPDDPESGCGGTLAKFANEGHAVTVIYLTRGEAGIEGKSHTEAAAIRTQEAMAACKIINAKPVFAGQTDGDTIFNNEWRKKIQALIMEEQPSVVFTHWPLDAHPDHQCASLLTIQSWFRSKKNFDLYFFEVCTGSQTMGFRPTDYIDISSVRDQKRKAVFCHASQNPEGIYSAPDCNHNLIESFRGTEAGVTAAEAFIRMRADYRAL
ncbi:MAG: PIG-L family deacetylase [Bacteroidetes bacterium]|nr:PIG-L family deacetylase [Bacteroidota bacterium]MBS1540125.1 PIG-L family deacetylase [Bacteroidota bacterium]